MGEIRVYIWDFRGYIRDFRGYRGDFWGDRGELPGYTGYVRSCIVCILSPFPFFSDTKLAISNLL